MNLVPLGDQGVIAYLDDEAAAVRFAAGVRAAGPGWLRDVVPAYASVGVFFDADAVRSAAVCEWLASRQFDGATADAGRPPVMHEIPVCYEFQLDLDRVRDHTGLTADEVIRLHAATEYTVYAVGFVPGFPYLGYLPPALSGVGRLASPRGRVEAGSVGLTGRQTGVYPLPRPGGWNLIGRTPLTIVDVPAGFFPIRVGDRVRFTRIDDRTFRERDGERLAGG